jgi:acylphosphatase
MQEDLKQLRLVVHGRVQGVGFRYFVVDAAQDLSLTGWTCNLPNGTVEVIAQGPESQLHRLQDVVRRGPPASQVTHVDSSWQPVGHEIQGFTVRR